MEQWVQLLFDNDVAGAVFFLVDLGPGAAVGGMQLEVNIGYNCYLTVTRRRGGLRLG